jgi:hypothetical protein
MAELLDVTVGSLQVTCSRLGISLRRRDVLNGNGARRTRIISRPFISHAPAAVGHMRDKSESGGAKFQIVFQHKGREQATDIRLTDPEIAQLGLEAMVGDLGMAELIRDVLGAVVKKNMIEEILRDNVPPSQL